MTRNYQELAGKLVRISLSNVSRSAVGLLEFVPARPGLDVLITLEHRRDSRDTWEMRRISLSHDQIVTLREGPEDWLEPPVPLHWNH